MISENKQKTFFHKSIYNSFLSFFLTRIFILQARRFNMRVVAFIRYTLLNHTQSKTEKKISCATHTTFSYPCITAKENFSISPKFISPYILKSVRVSVSVCVCVCLSVCKSPQRLLNEGTQKVEKGTRKREKIHRGARDHFRRIRFIISRVIN